MPYKVWLSDDDYTLIPRVSDIVSASQCEMTAWLNPINKSKRDGKKHPLVHENNIYALRGTLAHHRIENELRKMIDLPKNPLDLSYGEKELYKAISEDKELSRETNKHIETSIENFYDFMNKYKVKPLIPEQSIVYIKYDEDGKPIIEESLKGTIDLIGEMETENGMETVLIDWKTSKQFKDSSYQVQLTGYAFLMEASGKWEELEEQGVIKHPRSKWAFKNGRYDVDRALCVILGNSEKGFQIRWYDTSDKEFFRFWKLFNNPRKTLKSPTTGSWGMKLFCMFCQHKGTECPLYHRWVEEE